MGPTVGPTMGPSVCVHMTLLPVPGTASEVARETILGPSTGRLYRMGTQSASSPNLPRTSHPGSVMRMRAPMRYASKSRENERAGDGAPQARMDRRIARIGASPRRAGPTRFVSFVKKSAEVCRRRLGLGARARRCACRVATAAARSARAPAGARPLRPDPGTARNAEGPPSRTALLALRCGLESRDPSRGSYSSSAGAPSPKPKSASGPKISASDSESTVICAATSASSRSRS